jgi:hypothetical protein
MTDAYHVVVALTHQVLTGEFLRPTSNAVSGVTGKAESCLATRLMITRIAVPPLHVEAFGVLIKLVLDAPKQRYGFVGKRGS